MVQKDCNIIGKNKKMLELFELIKMVAQTDTRVFITGETGVGKELIAKAIHDNSLRKDKPFVGINCGALTETLLETELFGHEKGAFTGAIRTKIGKFEYANGGTLFLDEIGDISPRMQVRLLRVLQEKRIERVGGNHSIDIDVRIISATNRDIRKKISDGEFRLELFYRLNVIPIHVPPLRERTDDIPLLVQHFMNSYNRRFNKNIRHISSQTMNQLLHYPWPGNVRELENILERAFVITETDIIHRINFPEEVPIDDNMPYKIDINIPFPVAKDVMLKQFEKNYIIEALKQFQGNVSQAARKTGINTRTMWRKLKSYEIDRNNFI